jgi:hypothetical protein
MATTRTPIGRPPRSQVTLEAVELFRRVLEIEESGEQARETDGGRHDEYVDARTGCTRCSAWKFGMSLYSTPLASRQRRSASSMAGDRAAALRKALLAALKAERVPAP